MKRTFVGLILAALVVASLVLVAIGISLVPGVRGRIEGLLSGRTIVPLELDKPGVRSDSGRVSRRIILEDHTIGMVTDIGWSGPTNDSLGQIGVLGTSGLVVLTTELERRNSTELFRPGVVTRRLTRFEAGGRLEFVSYKEPWGHTIDCRNSTGARMWGREFDDGINSVAVGDVTGDGIQEVVLGMNAGGGILVLNAKGEAMSRIPELNVWCIGLCDIDGDGKCELVHADGRRLKFRAWTGEVVQEVVMSRQIQQFAVTKWSDRPNEWTILVTGRESLVMIDMLGREIRSLNAPGCHIGGAIRSIMVRGASNESVDYATLVSYPVWRRSILLIYDGEFNLTFQEVFVGAITALTGKVGGDKPEIWLGVENGLLGYRVCR